MKGKEFFLLGLFAILAIIGLVLMIKMSATGMMARPALPAEIQEMERGAGVIGKTPELVHPDVAYEYYSSEIYYMDNHAIQDMPQVWQKHEMKS